jgi:uncharacterized protein (TIGR03083 family)
MTLTAQLAALRARSDELVRTISGLTPDEWQAESNCPPWRVADLSAHLVTSAEGFVGSIQRGLSGSVDPPFPRSASRQDTLASAEPTVVAAALSRVTDEFEHLYEGRSAQELETLCWHRRGNRSVRWYAAHRLAEVAFHGWDLETSIGRSPQFDEDTARLLLPTLLESNVPRTYAAGLSTERGTGERYLLHVRDDADLTWLVTIRHEVLEVSRGDAPADVRITASAADLALLVYGRLEIDSLPDLSGDASVIGRFAQIFPRP